MRHPIQSLARPHPGHSHRGHTHFWERAVSRGGFIKTAAGLTATVLGAEVWLPGMARADSGSAIPRPIPGTLGPGLDFHVDIVGAPDQGVELSTITDFNGFLGAAIVDGTGTAVDAAGTHRFLFDTDMRFMDGVYVGMDGKTHSGTFGFV